MNIVNWATLKKEAIQRLRDKKELIEDFSDFYATRTENNSLNRFAKTWHDDLFLKDVPNIFTTLMCDFLKRLPSDIEVYPNQLRYDSACVCPDRSAYIKFTWAAQGYYFSITIDESNTTLTTIRGVDIASELRVCRNADSATDCYKVYKDLKDFLGMRSRLKCV